MSSDRRYLPTYLDIQEVFERTWDYSRAARSVVGMKFLAPGGHVLVIEEVVFDHTEFWPRISFNCREEFPWPVVSQKLQVTLVTGNAGGAFMFPANVDPGAPWIV